MVGPGDGHGLLEGAGFGLCGGAGGDALGVAEVAEGLDPVGGKGVDDKLSGGLITGLGVSVLVQLVLSDILN